MNYDFKFLNKPEHNRELYDKFNSVIKKKFKIEFDCISDTPAGEIEDTDSGIDYIRTSIRSAIYFVDHIMKSEGNGVNAMYSHRRLKPSNLYYQFKQYENYIHGSRANIIRLVIKCESDIGLSDSTMKLLYNHDAFNFNWLDRVNFGIFNSINNSFKVRSINQ